MIYQYPHNLFFVPYFLFFSNSFYCFKMLFILFGQRDHFFFKQFCLIFGFAKIRLIRLAPTLLNPVYCLEFELHFEGLEFE
jgi:hypothetical protein